MFPCSLEPLNDPHLTTFREWSLLTELRYDLNAYNLTQRLEFNKNCAKLNSFPAIAFELYSSMAIEHSVYNRGVASSSLTIVKNCTFARAFDIQ